MESTGKYWISFYSVLEEQCSIVLAHPKYVKAIHGKKIDKKDAKWIVDLFKPDFVVGSFMFPADIRQLRDLMRYRYKLTCFASSEKNRFQNGFTVSNIQLGNVVSDTLGKSSQKILDKILENPLDITPEQAGKFKVIKEHLEYLESQKADNHCNCKNASDCIISYAQERGKLQCRNLQKIRCSSYRMRNHCRTGNYHGTVSRL